MDIPKLYESFNKILKAYNESNSQIALSQIILNEVSKILDCDFGMLISTDIIKISSDSSERVRKFLKPDFNLLSVYDQKLKSVHSNQDLYTNIMELLSIEALSSKVMIDNHLDRKNPLNIIKMKRSIIMPAIYGNLVTHLFVFMNKKTSFTKDNFTLVKPLLNLVHMILSGYSQNIDIGCAAEPMVYKSIVNQASDPIVITNSLGIIKSINVAAEKIFNYKAIEIIGKSIEILMPEKHAKHHHKYMKRALAGNPTSKLLGKSRRLRAKRSNGSEFPVLISVFQVYNNDANNLANNIQINENGSINSGSSDNLTSVESSGNTVNNNVLFAAIIRDLTETEAREMRMIKDSKEKSMFLANMSHEIRTPVNGIIGMTTLIKDILSEEIITEDMRDDLLEKFEDINTSSYSLMFLINDILDITKITSGKLDIIPGTMSVHSCVNDAVCMLLPRAKEKGLDIRFRIDDSVPTYVYGDLQRIKQVLINLTTNAVKFTDSGYIEIQVCNNESSTKSSSDDSNSQQSQDSADKKNILLEFKIKDTGIGIAHSDIDKLFKEFGQVDSSNTRQNQRGTGLGLALSRSLCRLMGGDVYIESTEVNKGSVFVFTITVGYTDDMSDIDVSLLKGKTVLLVDDNKTNRRNISNMLRGWEMIPVAFSNGDEALDEIKSGRKYDLGLIDICMDGMNGITLSNHIKEYTNIPLVAMSSLGEKINSTNFELTITRPVMDKNLLSRLQKIFNVKKNRRQSIIKTNSKKTVPILVAEDIYLNQKVIMGYLKSLNYVNIDIANDGEEAIEYLKNKEYRVILLDLKMPKVSGFEVAEYINENYSDHERPTVIALTAIAMKGDREAYITEYNLDDYITKPIDINILRKTLNRFV